MSVRGVLIRIDSTDSLCDQAEMISPKSPNILKSEYFDTVRTRGKCIMLKILIEIVTKI